LLPAGAGRCGAAANRPVCGSEAGVGAVAVGDGTTTGVALGAPTPADVVLTSVGVADGVGFGLRFLAPRGVGVLVGGDVTLVAALLVAVGGAVVDVGATGTGVLVGATGTAVLVGATGAVVGVVLTPCTTFVGVAGAVVGGTLGATGGEVAVGGAPSPPVGLVAVGGTGASVLVGDGTTTRCDTV
jgi:hypothetical protein